MTTVPSAGASRCTVGGESTTVIGTSPLAPWPPCVSTAVARTFSAPLRAFVSVTEYGAVVSVPHSPLTSRQTVPDETAAWVSASGLASTATVTAGPWTAAPGAGDVIVTVGAGTCSTACGDAGDVPTWLTARIDQVPAPWWESATSRVVSALPGSATYTALPPGLRCAR